MPLLNQDDQDIILEAIRQGGKIWDNEILEPVKRKIKNFYRHALNEQCCYCRRDTTDEFNMVLDIEHILPKSKFAIFMFSPFNLSVACKRCNMEIKKEDVSFLIDQITAQQEHNDATNYLLLHPNYDQYSDHLNLQIYRYDDKRLVKYHILDNSEKGSYTKSYFKLDLIEQDSFDNAQGIKTQEYKFSAMMDRNQIEQIQKLLAI